MEGMLLGAGNGEGRAQHAESEQYRNHRKQADHRNAFSLSHHNQAIVELFPVVFHGMRNFFAKISKNILIFATNIAKK